MKKSVADAFREAVREIMERKGISVTDLARINKMSRSGLSRVLNGHEAVSMSRADRIAESLGTELWKLLRKSKKAS